MNLTAYLLTAMLFWSPLHRSLNTDEPTDRLARYSSIAADISFVVEDPEETPLFDGKYGREKTGLLLASIALHESGFHANVDSGKKRGDNGRSVCIMQVMTGMYGSKHHYTAEYLLSDRKNCIRAALGIARDGSCSGGLHRRFRGYASGTCAKRDDPQKEANVSRAARGLVNGYYSFIYSFPVSKHIKKQ